MTTGIKRGVLLMNLGSPDSTEVKDVKRYLNQFLMDGRVIDKPYILRALLVRGIIVPFRAPKSAEAYETIWTKEGSPLIVYSKQLRDAVQQQVEMPVEITMRYGNPTPEAAFEKLLERLPGMDEVVAVPLYPHYAMSSFETAVEFVKEIHSKKKYGFRLSFIDPYFKEPDYIEALADNMKPYLQQDYDHILFSYHGVPARHILKSDITGKHCLQSPDCCSTPSPAHAFCYRHQCITTTKLVTEKLSVPIEKYSISFQSRLGKGWLEPFTDVRLEEMPKEGIRKLLVICPAFVSDCLETLEEIEMRGKESFLEAGGESYKMIPCLNTHPLWVKALSRWVTEF
ncbi:MAG TPA: ferrochelatase [Chitinophagaceae bacterium]|nr:ferrochelatase [Chitinophagaceae bacterium]